MGLMFARRRIDEAAKRAANKAKAQAERQGEVKAKAEALKQPIAVAKSEAPKGEKKNADSKGTK